MEQTSIIKCDTAQDSTRNKKNGLAKHDYSYYLVEESISFMVASPYLLVGSPGSDETWLIHISIVRQQFANCIKPILKFLKGEEIVFAIPANADLHSSLLDGRSSSAFTGKIITICISEPTTAEKIVEKLISLTEKIVGPAIPCAFHLTEVIAVEYGLIFGESNLFTENRGIFYRSQILSSINQTLKLKGIDWPFKSITPIGSYKNQRLLKNQYIPIQTFKNEAKGTVTKCLKLNYLLNIQWCVLKHGRKFQSFDNNGRDEKDRLKWQLHLHRRLEPKQILPKAIEYFEINGDGFLSLAYIESVSLAEKAAQLNEGKTWRTMPAENKRHLIKCLIDIIRIIDIFHSEGLIHRDITQGNFLVNDTGQVFAIDIELAYDTRNAAPPFSLGTVGYMSSNQLNGGPPSYADDIYGLGALFISLFTGILPNKFNHRRLDYLAENLNYFVGLPVLESVMLSSIQSDPLLRPSLTDISAALEIADAILLTSDGVEVVPVTSYRPHRLENILSDCVNMLTGMLFPCGTQINRGVEAIKQIHEVPGICRQIESSPLPDVAELAILALFKQYPMHGADFGLILRQIDIRLKSGEPIMKIDYDLQIMAIQLATIEKNVKRALDFMSLAVPAAEPAIEEMPPGISQGLAGRGLKLLFLMADPNIPSLSRELNEMVNRLMELQLNDGSWAVKTTTQLNKKYKATGFSHGVAGITYFLLCYYENHASIALRTSILDGLEWLAKQRKLEHGKFLWPVSAENETVDPWLEHGFSGVALTFIKAYEVLGIDDHKQIACEVLRYHPLDITSNYSSFGNGLSGLGEIYLEAYRVFTEHEWHRRAAAVKDALLNSCYRDTGICYWLDGTQLQPTPDFWDGNSGIHHFLFRFAHPNEISFPDHLIK